MVADESVACPRDGESKGITERALLARVLGEGHAVAAASCAGYHRGYHHVCATGSFGRACTNVRAGPIPAFMAQTPHFYGGLQSFQRVQPQGPYGIRTRVRRDACA